MCKRLIGRLDVNSLSFPGMKMRMIGATFHCAGKHPFSKTALNNWVRYYGGGIDGWIPPPHKLLLVLDWPSLVTSSNCRKTGIASAASPVGHSG
jgi:hypothetical protein